MGDSESFGYAGASCILSVHPKSLTIGLRPPLPSLIDLPRRPSKGNRRQLESLWLKELERRGLRSFLDHVPTEAPPALHKAVGEFNQRLFWDCHESLEDVWRETPYPLRFFYHGIIKVAVGFHHMSRHNRKGALVKLSDGVRLLRLFQPQFLGLRTDMLLEETSPWPARMDPVGGSNRYSLN